MPNNFGGDQYDPEYFVGNASETDPPTAALTDKRIRSVVGAYRAVIPDGVQKGSRFFTNNSPVVIEKRSQDATGAEKWDLITSFPKPGTKSNNQDTDYAIYWLLAGPDAE